MISTKKQFHPLGENQRQPIKFFQKACDLNDGSGCSQLGLSYKEGKGVKQDDFKAFKFFRINIISALRIKSFITTFLIIYPNPKIEIKKTHKPQLV
jgi:hypothetical protein